MLARYVVVGFVLALALAVRASAFALPEACGKDETQFKVKTAKKQPLPALESGKAQIVFIESLDGEFSGAPTARFGVDGAWAGATRGASFFALSVPAGIHKLCASRQSSIRAEKENVGVASLSAQAGKVYFFEFKVIRAEIGDLTMKAGSSLPQQYPGSMTAKRKDTVDQATFTQLSEEEAHARLKDAAFSTSVTKD